MSYLYLRLITPPNEEGTETRLALLVQPEQSVSSPRPTKRALKLRDGSRRPVRMGVSSPRPTKRALKLDRFFTITGDNVVSSPRPTKRALKLLPVSGMLDAKGVSSPRPTKRALKHRFKSESRSLARVVSSPRPTKRALKLSQTGNVTWLQLSLITPPNEEGTETAGREALRPNCRRSHHPAQRRGH